MEFDLSNILSAISVILVFLTVIFDFLSKEIDLLICKNKPLEKEDQYKRELQNAFSRSVFKSILHSIAFLILAFILLPTVIALLLNSVVDFWRFDVLKTLFVFIYVFIVIFTIISIKMTRKLLKRKNEVLRK